MKSKRFGAKMPFLLALAFLLAFAREGTAGAARSGINANSSSSAGYAVHHLNVAPYRILGLKSGNCSRFS